ncbi:MAG: AAA family ATPase, partial [Planctomycetes bacterium]|nr:AAA family ATPase [Planctomycetota bacterium]
MYLKRVTITGFKTFADTTVIEFGQEVTSVIGPNGCGKSNIVDSIRWALGEQSAKSLRGAEMVDVIFNGSSSRRPAPYCDVCLVIDNGDKSLPIDSAEVAIRRKLHQNGQGEYYINDNPCRLRDVRELFMDTGLGAKTNTVIEQSQLNRLLEASSKERKVLIEEAAGISRFRRRRQESIAKLDRVKENNTRLQDIINEV